MTSTAQLILDHILAKSEEELIAWHREQNKPKLLSYEEIDKLSVQVLDEHLGIRVKCYGSYTVNVHHCFKWVLPALHELEYTISVSKAIKPFYQLYHLDRNRGTYYKVPGASVVQEEDGACTTARIYANLAYLAFQDREARLNAC